MADFKWNVSIGWDNITWIIKFNIETNGNVVEFNGIADFPVPIIFAYRIGNGIMEHFSPGNINPIKKELIIDVLMSVYEEFKLSSDTRN